MPEVTIDADYATDVEVPFESRDDTGTIACAVREFTYMRLAFKFDPSVIPAGSTVDSIELELTCVIGSFNTGADQWLIKSYGANAQDDPETDSDADCATRAASGTTYETTTEYRTGTGVRTVDITSVDSISHLEACIDAAIPFSVGIKSDDETYVAPDERQFFLSAHDTADPPRLIVNYTEGAGGLGIPIASHHYRTMGGA